MNIELSKRFGLIIKEFRKQQLLSQEELAERAGVHRTYIGMIERGEKNVTLENIQKLATAFDIQIKILFEKL